jgi:hypothetical protein
MGQSNQRDRHLQKINATTGSAQEFVKALEGSPYAAHRRAAVGLKKQLDDMSAATIAELKKKEDSQEFKKSLGL